jgi:hypothetical protein
MSEQQVFQQIQEDQQMKAMFHSCQNLLASLDLLEFFFPQARALVAAFRPTVAENLENRDFSALAPNPEPS